MNKLKDFNHNISDILLAVVIVLIAAGIVFWRLRIILEYPERAARESIQTTQTEELQDESGVTDNAGTADDAGEADYTEDTDTTEDAQG